MLAWEIWGTAMLFEMRQHHQMNEKRTGCFQSKQPVHTGRSHYVCPGVFILELFHVPFSPILPIS